MSEDGKNLEVFFVNGRQGLLCSDVQGWFARSNLAAPSEESVAPIARAINHLDLFGYLWKDDSVYKKRRIQNESFKRLDRIAKALKTLQQDIPEALESTRLGYPGDFEELKKPYDELLGAVNVCMPGYVGFLSKPRGRCRTGWHRVARRLAPLFSEANKSAGGPRLGFGKPTSPGIPFIRQALLRLGIDESEETIVDAMRSPRKRQRKKTGN